MDETKLNNIIIYESRDIIKNIIRYSVGAVGLSSIGEGILKFSGK
jgi:hypothetical protein